MVALIFLLILAADILTPSPQSGPYAKEKVTIAEIGAFSTALDLFKEDNSFYPANLNAFIIKPANASTNWHQYLDHVPLNPWGHPYLYVSPGQHNTNSYDLSSAGPDGIPGTPDDIVNWQQPQ